MSDSIYSLTNVSDAELPDAVAKVGMYLKGATGTAIDYSPDELDDLVGRKVEEAPISGDALALIVRARRGTARAIGQFDEYEGIVVKADRMVWGATSGHVYMGASGNRRMAAVGYRAPHLNHGQRFGIGTAQVGGGLVNF